MTAGLVTGDPARVQEVAERLDAWADLEQAMDQGIACVVRVGDWVLWTDGAQTWAALSPTRAEAERLAHGLIRLFQRVTGETGAYPTQH